jgi:hypothetical protein
MKDEEKIKFHPSSLILHPSSFSSFTFAVEQSPYHPGDRAPISENRNNGSVLNLDIRGRLRDDVCKLCSAFRSDEEIGKRF